MPKRFAALAAIPFITSGCAGLHPGYGVSSVAISYRIGPMQGPVAALFGDSDMAPGKAAMAVIPPSSMCQDIMAVLCAIVIPVGVPIAAAVGATMKTSQKLPLEQVIELNDVTADVARQLSLGDSFTAALEAEAQRRGIALNVANPDAEVIVEPTSLIWDISPGNRTAMRIEVEVIVERDGDEDTHQVTYRTGAEQVERWIENNGRPIQQSIDEVMAGVSHDIWERILGREPKQ